MPSRTHYLLRRYRDFRIAADVVAAAWGTNPAVLAVALIGSLARPPWKEVPRFSPYRRAGTELWHECQDIDLALWLRDLHDLGSLRRTKDLALRGLHEAGEAGVASHQIDAFLFEPATGRYLGRLCDFNKCPKHKPDCDVPGCGAIRFLRQHQGFRWRPETLTAEAVMMLFDRAGGPTARAADLPLPAE